MFQIHNLQKVGQDHGVQFLQCCHSAANIKIYKTRPTCIFMLSQTISEILTFQVLNLQKEVDQGHGVKFSHWRHSMENIKIYKCRSVYFLLTETVSDILTFQIMYPQKAGRGNGIRFSQWCHLVANIKICKGSPMHYCASSNRFSHIDVSNFLPSKSRSRSRSKIFAMMPFDGK